MSLVLVAQAASMPTAPVIAAAVLSASQINVTLVTPSTEPTFGIGSYTLYYSTSASGPFAAVPLILAFPYVLSGLGAGTTYYLYAVGVDQSPNTKASAPSNTVTVTTQAGTSKAALRMANTWIGGSRSAYATDAFRTYASKCDPILFGWLIGGDFVLGDSMKNTMAAIKAKAIAAGRPAPQQGIYFDSTFIGNPGLDQKLWNMFNSNHWLLSNSYPGGAPIINSAGGYVTNLTAGATRNAAGQLPIEYVAAFMIAAFRNGDQSVYTSGNNVANPEVGYFNADDQMAAAPSGTGGADWNRDGTGGENAATIGTAIRVANVAQANLFRSLTGLPFAGNTSQTGFDISVFPEYVGQYDISFMDQQIGSKNTVLNGNGWALFVSGCRQQATCIRGSGDQVFATYVSGTDGSDAITFASDGTFLTRSPIWQGARFQISAMGCTTNAAYAPSLTLANAAEQSPIWFDAFAVNRANRQAYAYPNVDAGIGWTGSWVDPVQTAAWQNGVWRRRAQYCTVYCNPPGNGPRTVTFDSGTPLQAHFLGTQQPGYDNGNVITGITLQDRDGVILCNQ